MRLHTGWFVAFTCICARSITFCLAVGRAILCPQMRTNLSCSSPCGCFPAGAGVPQMIGVDSVEESDLKMRNWFTRCNRLTQTMTLWSSYTQQPSTNHHGPVERPRSWEFFECRAFQDHQKQFEWSHERLLRFFSIYSILPCQSVTNYKIAACLQEIHVSWQQRQWFQRPQYN